MSEFQAIDDEPFTLRGRNPDVLSCIANLSNDEVFTPPDFANRMLDTLADGWAADHDGESLWSRSDVTFLDPCTKSGVFLREITRRLLDGLADEIPDLQARVDHILTRQVFGIGVTQLTALLARRSLYCSKDATGAHSVTGALPSPDGHVWWERTEHSWDKSGRSNKCVFCGASRDTLDRGDEAESHAYPFIHTDDITGLAAKMFGDDMQFDVIIGNPPYQLKGGGGGSNDSSIYPLFVDQAVSLNPKYLSMVIPSRWLAGGRGMSDFREYMLSSGKIRNLIDFTQMSSAFPGVDFEGGVGYFLWDRSHEGDCEYQLILGDKELPSTNRLLDEFDIFVRDTRALEILRKVLALKEPKMSEIISSDTPFGLATNFDRFSEDRKAGYIEYHHSKRGKRLIGWVADELVQKNRQLISHWKVLLPEAYGERGAIPAMVLGPPMIVQPKSVCSQTFLVAGPFDSETNAHNMATYYSTKFFRFLVSLRKISQHGLRSTYSWVPQQKWNQVWTDETLAEKYALTQEELNFIEAMIRPMTIEGVTDR